MPDTVMVPKLQRSFGRIPLFEYGLLADAARRPTALLFQPGHRRILALAPIDILCGMV
jgi:hypothetical protein